MSIKDLVWTGELFDDASTRKKLTVMDKMDAISDDFRNDIPDIAVEVETYLQLGKKYRFSLKIEEID